MRLPKNLEPAENTADSEPGKIRFSVTKDNRSLNLVCNPKRAIGSETSPLFAPKPRPNVKSVFR